MKIKNKSLLVIAGLLFLVALFSRALFVSYGEITVRVIQAIILAAVCVLITVGIDNK